MVGVAVLYLVNNLEVPVSLFKSYSAYAGANDANVQWWFGHNAVAMVLTAPVLAMFYYFLPKSTGVPIYSHRISIIAFWSLVFMYLWTGAHHLLLTPVPDWVQTLAMAFSMFLIAPSWGSVFNGYYSMNGHWHQMRVELPGQVPDPRDHLLRPADAAGTVPGDPDLLRPSSTTPSGCPGTCTWAPWAGCRW